MKGKQLNPMAVARAQQAQLERAAAEKKPEECVTCGGTIFTPVFELRVVPGIEIGAPQDIVCRHATKHACVACMTMWSRKKEGGNGQDKDSRGEGSKGGTDPDSKDGGIILP